MWLTFGEVPPATTIVGGSIVLISTVAASLVSQGTAPLPRTADALPSNCKS